MAGDAMKIAKLAQMINAEKKSYQIAGTLTNLGQVNINDSGALCIDITPLITQGSGTDQRTGASFKLHSALYQFQFNQMSSATLKNRVCIEFWVNKGQALGTAKLLEYTHGTSTFSGVTDINSPRNQDRFADFQLLRRVYRTIDADSISGDVTNMTFDIPIKFNRGKGHHVRLVSSLANNAPLDVLNGQMYMTIRVANGNASTTTVSTKDIPITAINTGLQVRFAYRTWFYDN